MFSLFFRLADNDGVIRRIVMCYDCAEIGGAVQNEESEKMLLYRADPGVTKLKRLTEDAHVYEKLGFGREIDTCEK